MDECTCPIRPNMTYEELRDEILIPQLYCTSLKTNPYKGWVCSNLDKHLQVARADKRSKEYRQKKLLNEGVPPEEIVLKKSKRRFPKENRQYTKGSLEDLI